VRDLLPRANLENLERRSLETIDLLALHWDGGARLADDYSPLAHYVAEALFHIRKDWGTTGLGDPPTFGHGLMYHYKIARDGRLFWTRDWQEVTWSVTAANRRALNICLDATDGQPSNAAQLLALRGLLDWLVARLPRTGGRVFGHGELTFYGNRTSCPGPGLTWLAQAWRARSR
jgi:hypothetical protein